MYILDNLWNCKIRPSERAFREGGQYADLMYKSRALEDAFYSDLTVCFSFQSAISDLTFNS